MFRVYDMQAKEWIRRNVVLTQNGDLMDIKHRIRGKYKILPKSRYVYHSDIRVHDKNNRLIYEGDICLTDGGMIAVITYFPEISAYVLLDYNDSKYYTITESVAKHIQIVGNCFDNAHLLKFKAVELKQTNRNEVNDGKL